MIKEYFANYFLHTSDVTFHMDLNHMEIHKRNTEPWKITLIDTGELTQTGGRLARLRDYLDSTFCFTYGDGVANVNIKALIEHHRQQSCKATLTAVQPPGRYGAINLEETKSSSSRKSRWRWRMVEWRLFCSGTFCDDLVDGDSCVWEQGPLNNLADNKLSAYLHDGFWHQWTPFRPSEAWLYGPLVRHRGRYGIDATSSSS